MEESTTIASTEQSPIYLVHPDIWRTFAQEFTRLWKQQVEASRYADAQRRGVG